MGEVTARDGTIAKLKEQHEKVTADSVKKSTTMRSQEVTIDELKGQRTGLRNKVDEVEAIVEARDSEIGTLKALIDIRNEEINGLEENQTRLGRISSWLVKRESTYSFDTMS